MTDESPSLGSEVSSELENVRADLARAKKEFQHKCESFEARLQALERSERREEPAFADTAIQPQLGPGTSGERLLVELTSLTPEAAPADTVTTEDIVLAPVTELESLPELTEPLPAEPELTEPQPLVQPALDAVALTAIGPFVAPLEVMRQAYARARDEGRLAIFFLTLLGVVTTLIGTAYVLQYGFSNWFTLPAKLGLSEAVALGLMIGGARLWKQKAFREFGSALLGLGVVMSYLVVYFATESFHLVSPTWGFAGLALTTGLAYALARLYDTKIVASLMLFGGAFTPFMLDLEIALNPMYQGFLLSLCVASLQLARKVPWPALGKHAFVVSAAILELGVFAAPEREVGTIHIVLLEAFHGLFALWILTKGRQFVTELSTQNGLLLCANVGVLASTLWAQLDDSTGLAILLTANAVPYAALGVMHKPRSRALAGGLLSVGAALLGLALAVASQLDTMGLLLAQEAMLLVFLGVRWELKPLRREGYLLALGASVLSLFVWAKAPVPVEPLTTPFLNLLTLGATLFALQALTRRYGTLASPRWDRDDAWVEKASVEAVSVWFAGTGMWTLVQFFPVYGWHLAVVPMALLVWKAERRALPVTTFVGFALGTLLLIPALRSVLEVGSFRFSLQLASGKLAMIEILATAWIGPIFMRKISPNSSSLEILKNLQLGVYWLLPVIWVPSLARRWPESRLLLLWASTVLAGALALGIRAKTLRFEFWGLCLLAWGAMMLGTEVGNFSMSQNVAAWLLGLGLQGLLILVFKGYTRQGASHWLAAPVLTGSVFYLGALLGHSALWAGLGGSGSACLVGMYFLALPHWYKLYAPLREVLRPVTRLGQLSLLAAVAVAGWSHPEQVPVGWVCLSALIFSVSAYGKGRVSLLVRSNNPRHRAKLWLLELHVSHALVFSGYAAMLARFTDNVAGIALTVAMVVHGIVMLAQLLRPRFSGLRGLTIVVFLVALMKLFLLDLRSASTLQKMVAFIALGGLCLGAAYVFQRFAQKSPSNGSEG